MALIMAGHRRRILAEELSPSHQPNGSKSIFVNMAERKASSHVYLSTDKKQESDHG